MKKSRKKISKIVKYKNVFEVKPSKELQKAFDLFPSVVKRKERVAKEKARIQKNFESARTEIFGKRK